MKILRVVGKNIHLNVAEQEWLKHMMGVFGCPESVALDEIIKYKREQAYGFEQQGNHQLSRMLLQEIDEWDGVREEEYKQHVSRKKEVTIILP